MTEANVVINIEGKPYLLSKHLKKSSLIDIISKLQEDLLKIKQYTKSQVDFRVEVVKLKAENQDLETKLQTLQQLYDTKENRETPSQGELFKKQIDIRKRLKLTYENRVKNTVQLYEEKINGFKKKITDLEKDREAFAEAIEKKQIAIGAYRNDAEKWQTEREETEAKHNAVIRELKQKFEDERQRFHSEEQKIRTERDVIQKNYTDLDKIRKYLEKNNATMKTTIQENNRTNEERIAKISNDNESNERRHLDEIRQMGNAVEIIVKEAESKLERIENKMKRNKEDYEKEISKLSEEIDHYKEVVKTLEQDLQTTGNETAMQKEIVQNMNRFFEEKLRVFNEKTYAEKLAIEREINRLKEKYEAKIETLKHDHEVLEKDAETKRQKFMQAEQQSKWMEMKLTGLKKEVDENNNKYVENYGLLKQKMETIKLNYESELNKLKLELTNQEKTLDDVKIQNKKYEKQIEGLKYANETMKRENEEDVDKLWERIKNEKECYTEEIEKVKESFTKKLRLQENEYHQKKMEYNEIKHKYEMVEIAKQNLDKLYNEIKDSVDVVQENHRNELHNLKSEHEQKVQKMTLAYEELLNESLTQKKLIKELQDTKENYTTIQKDLQETIKVNYSKFKEQLTRSQQEAEENKHSYKEDLENMKKHLSYKEDLVQKMEDEIGKLKNVLTVSIAEKNEVITELLNNKEMIINEIKNNYELQKQKYDILIYEFYKELKEQTAKTEEVDKIKKELEYENISLKDRMNEILLNIQKQNEQFGNDMEVSKLMEYIIA